MMTTALDGRQKRTVTTVTPTVTVTVVTEKELKCDALRSERHSSILSDDGRQQQREEGVTVREPSPSRAQPPAAGSNSK